jgi:hypothetical protein
VNFTPICVKIRPLEMALQRHACVLECGGKRSATPLSNDIGLENEAILSTFFCFPKRCHSHRTPRPYGASGAALRKLNALA